MISKISPDRSKIVIEREDHVKYWTRHFGVTKDELARQSKRLATLPPRFGNNLVSRRRLLLEGSAAVRDGRGRSPHWLKVKNPNAPAVKREAEEDWGR